MKPAAQRKRPPLPQSRHSKTSGTLAVSSRPVLCGPNGCRETIRACDFCGGLGIVEVQVADR